MAVRRKWLGIGSALGVAAVIVAAFAFSGNEKTREAERLEAAAEARYEAALSRAVAGDAEAEFTVAEALRRGDGVARDLDQAVQWYRKAAEKAHAGAQYALGTLYEKGEGVPRDYTRAADWYRLAANLGHHPGAAFTLAQLYYNGRGLPANPEEALTWYRRAADGGNPAAQYVLGTILENGWNVPVDLIGAYKWFTLAIPKRSQAMAVNKRFDPAAARAKLRPWMTEFEVMRGEQAAARWRPANVPQGVARDGLPLVRKPSEKPSAAATTAAAKSPRRAVRLFSFDLSKGPTMSNPMTVSLLVEFVGEAEKTEFCVMVPRVRDAVTQVLWSRPLPASLGAVSLRAIDERLRGPVNQVLGPAANRRVMLYPGNRPLNPNDALKTPFDIVEDCASPAAP